MFRRLQMLVAAVVLVLFTSGLMAATARADSGDCQVSVSPQDGIPNQQTDFTFNFTNNQSTPVKVLLITTPSTEDVYVSASAPGWNASFDPNSGITLSGGTLNPGNSLSIDVQIILGADDSGTLNWGFLAFDGSGGGFGNLVCQDSNQTLTLQDIAPHISNVGITNISAKSVTVNWSTTNPANSRVLYGLTSGYGSQSSLDSTLDTSHAVALTNLKANTIYHYQVVSTTAQNGSETSSDNTFLTAVQPPSVASPINITVTNPNDTTPPTVALSTNLPKVVKALPTMSGQASDKIGVALIEYSVDGGLDWLPADQATGLGGPKVSFSFTPAQLEDGTYQLEVRAINLGGVITTTTPVMVVVDHLPPIVGGSVISIGPQVLEPDSQGVVNTQAGVDMKISMSAVGGATNLSLHTAEPANPLKTISFSLTEASDSGLWQGSLSFQQPGMYSIVAQGLNGASYIYVWLWSSSPS